MNVTHKINMDLTRRSVLPRIDAVQGDTNTRIVELSLYAAGEAWTIPDKTSVMIRYRRPDGAGGVYDTLPDGTVAWSITGNVVSFTLSPAVLGAAGGVKLQVEMILDEVSIGTFVIVIHVERDPSMDAVTPEDYYNLRQWLEKELEGMNLGNEETDPPASSVDIPNLYVWKKYSSEVNEEAVEAEIFLTKLDTSSAYDAVEYADSIEISDGAISLVSSTTITEPTYALLNEVLPGKYVYSHNTRKYYRVPADANINTYVVSGAYTGGTGSSGFKFSKAYVLTAAESGGFLKYVASEARDTYPADGVHTDGFRYVYYKQLAECVNEDGVAVLPLPPTAEVGQYIRVAAVDDNGKVTETEAVTVEELEDISEVAF